MVDLVSYLNLSVVNLETSDVLPTPGSPTTVILKICSPIIRHNLTNRKNTLCN